MGVLQRLGLARSSIWEPPTPLEKILDAPLRALVTLLYGILLRLRGRPVHPPRGRVPVRVVCISDTHDQRVAVPDGDLLVHAGDMTNAGTAADIQAQLDWLAGLPHRHKVVVSGNHDSWFDPRSRTAEDKKTGAKLDFKGIHFLQDSSVRLEFEDGRELNVYGAGDLPQCGGTSFAFQYARDLHPWKNRIPRETDILVTHTPPRYHLDLNLGCAGLLAEIWRVKPKLHIFGHVHRGKGRKSVYFDECQRAYEAVLARPARGLLRDLFWPDGGHIEALKMLFYGLNSVLFKWIMQGAGTNDASIMVNAGQMVGNTGKMGRVVEVVEL